VEKDVSDLRLAGQNDLIVVIRHDAQIAGSSGSINVYMPLRMLSPLLDQGPSQAKTDQTRRGPAEFAHMARARIGGARVAVDALLGHAEIPLRDIARLHVGDIVPLRTDPNGPISVEVGGAPRFRAKPGRRGELKAVKVTGLIRR
jgi:flagellar motor switch protein FliM